MAVQLGLSDTCAFGIYAGQPHDHEFSDYFMFPHEGT